MSVTAKVGADKSRSYSGDYMAVGKLAESIIIPWLRDNPGVVEVNDLTDLRPLQEADVDCSIKLTDGRITLAEIKSDKWLRGESGTNVLFEILRLNHTAPPDRFCVLGWTARSPAKWLLYFSPTLSKVYKCRFDDLRRCAQRYTREVRKEARIDLVETDSIKSTINILIPWGYCKNIFELHDVSRYVIKK
jgi:hypothetical protein